MAVTLTGSGGLFKRLGDVVGYARGMTSVQDTTMPNYVDAVLAEYSDADKDWVAPLLADLDRHRSGILPTIDACRLAAETTLIEQVNDDAPLARKTALVALEELRLQMGSSGDDIDAPIVSATPTADGGNTCDGEFVVSVTDDRSNALTHVRAETIRAECVTSAQDGITQSGLERWSIRGEAAYPWTDWRWPGGSGMSGTIRTTSAEEDGGMGPGRNKTRNGDFYEFTSGAPDYWTITVGVAGADIDEETTQVFRADSCLKFVGDGATLSGLKQQLGAASASPAQLVPKRKMATSVWLKAGAGVAAGVLRVSVRDGAGSDISSTALSITLSGVSTSAFEHYSFVWATPVPLPEECYVHVELTTAITAAAEVYVGAVIVAEMERPQVGGPYMIYSTGPTDPSVEDGFDLAIANNRTASGPSAWSWWLDRFFNLYPSGIYLPTDSGGTETILDSLIP